MDFLSATGTVPTGDRGGASDAESSKDWKPSDTSIFPFAIGSDDGGGGG